jgi:putative MATE family efflux protein
MFLGNLLQATYNTVDSIWVGRFLGPHALGAVSVSMPISFGLVSMVMGLAVATTTLIAQARGAGDEVGVRRISNNSVVLMGILGLVLSVVGVYVRHPMLRLINTPPEIASQAAVYLGIFLAGTFFAFLYNVASAILRGLGDSRTPMVYLMWAVIANMILDPICILGLGPIPAMGVGGAALATVFAQALSAVFSIRHLIVSAKVLRLSRADGPLLDRDLTAQTLRIGLPAGLQQTMVSFAALAVNSVINSFGPAVVAGAGAGARLDQFAFMPAFSISMAVSALVGQNVGAGRFERVKEIVYWSGVLGAAITGAVSIVVLSIPQTLLGMFTTDPAVLEVGTSYLRIMGLVYIPFALMFVMTGVLRGAGDTVATMFNTLGSLWLVRVPLVRFLSGPAGLGTRGLWIGMAASSFVGLGLNYAYYRSGRWKRKVVITAKEA